VALIFTDLFDRGDGPVGNDWYIDSGTFVISGGVAVCGSSTSLRPTTQPTTKNVLQQIVLTTPVAFPKTVTFRFRGNGDWSDRLSAQFVLSATSVTVSLQHCLSNSNVTDAQISENWTYGATVNVWAAIIDQRLMAWIDGNLVLQAYIPYLTTAGRTGIYLPTANTMVDEYYLVEQGNDAFTVQWQLTTPEDGTYTLTFYNSGLPWTVGTPGEPVFATLLGTLSGQEVLTEDTATAIYTPPVTQAQDQAYDPLNDQYYPFTIQTPFTNVGGGSTGGGLTTEQGLTIDALHDWLDSWNDQISGQTTLEVRLGAISLLLNSSYTQGDGSALGAMLDTLLAQDGRLATIDAQSYSAMSLASGISNAGAWTLQTVWQYIQGTGAHTIADVMDAIADLPAPEGGDLTTIINILWEIRTTSSWTLGSVKTWIESIPETDLQPVLDAIDALKGIGNRNLTEIYNAVVAIDVSGINTSLDTISDKLDAIPTDAVTSLQPVLDAIDTHNDQLTTQAAAILDAIGDIPTNPVTSLDGVLHEIGDLVTLVTDKAALVLEAIEALADLLGPSGAPVWPGAAEATLGQSQAISSGVTITAPMDGVIIAITGYRTAAGYYTFDDIRSLRNAGSLSFFDDSGHQEPHQHLGFTSAIYSPKGMRRAAGVKIRAEAQITGTVTPWTISAPT